MYLFVYGTLKTGGRANDLISDQKFVRAAKTTPHYSLYKLGWFPGLKKIGTNQIEGEIWQIDESRLPRLDAFEGHPTLFKRTRIELEDNDLEVYGYLYNGRIEEEMNCGTNWPV